MEKFISADNQLKDLFTSGAADWVRAPNNETDRLKHSTARHHQDFDDDAPTIQATLARILGDGETRVPLKFHKSASAYKSQRKRLQ